MYSFSSNVRFSEVDEKRFLSLSSIINYFQDCSTFHSESVGLGFDYLEKKHRVWLMSAWQVVIHRRPTFGESIQICTSPHEFKSLYGYRNFSIKDAEGNDLVVANSIWVYADTETGRPAKILPEDSEPYGIEPPYDMEYADRKIAVPDQFEELQSFSITQSHLDCNHHVNNGQYIRMAEAYLPADFTVSELRADYRKAALLHDTVIPHRTLTATDCTIVLTGTDGKPFTTIQFFKKLK